MRSLIVGTLLLLCTAPAWAVGTLTCTPLVDGILGPLGANSYFHVASCVTSAAYTAGGDQFANVGRDLCGSSARLVGAAWVANSIAATGATTAVGFAFNPTTQKVQCFFTPTAVTLPFAECTTQGQSTTIFLEAFCH